MMENIQTIVPQVWLTSDLHFGHDRAFLWGPRGFRSIEEHDAAIIANWNDTVAPYDDVYILGDLMLGDNIHGMECLRKLNGKLHLVRGNHDSDVRWKLYETLDNVVEMGDALRFKYRKIHFYCSHFPTMTTNLEKESIYQCTCCLSGHTHSKDKFYQDIPFIVNVALDARHNTPVLLDDVIQEIKDKAKECKSFL